MSHVWLSALCGMWQLCVGGQNSSRVPSVHLILSCALVIFLKVAQTAWRGGDPPSLEAWKAKCLVLWVISAECVPGLLRRVHCLAHNVRSLLTLRFCDSSSTSLSPTGSLVNNSWTKAVKLIPRPWFLSLSSHGQLWCSHNPLWKKDAEKRSKVAPALQAKPRSETLWFLELCCRT